MKPSQEKCPNEQRCQLPQGSKEGTRPNREVRQLLQLVERARRQFVRAHPSQRQDDAEGVDVEGICSPEGKQEGGLRPLPERGDGREILRQ